MSKNPSNMKGNRSRDDDGELRRKRDDTLVRSLQKEYGITYQGMRSNQKLAAIRKRVGMDDIKDINKYFRKLDS